MTHTHGGTDAPECTTCSPDESELAAWRQEALDRIHKYSGGDYREMRILTLINEVLRLRGASTFPYASAQDLAQLRREVEALKRHTCPCQTRLAGIPDVLGGSHTWQPGSAPRSTSAPIPSGYHHQDVSQ